MGVDLTLIPVNTDRGHGAVWPHVQLALERRQDLWRVIDEAHIERPLGRPVWSPDGEDETMQESTENPYGLPWTYATAADLVRVMEVWQRSVVEPAPRMGWENRAALAYLKHLPPATKVVLRWH